MSNFQITFPFPEMGKLSANSRCSWHERARVARQRKEDAIALIRARGWWQEPIQRGTISITWRMKDNRDRDFDNLLPEVKPYCDGLKAAGVIIDDSARRFQLLLAYEPGAREATVEITIHPEESTDSLPTYEMHPWPRIQGDDTICLAPEANVVSRGNQNRTEEVA